MNYISLKAFTVPAMCEAIENHSVCRLNVGVREDFLLNSRVQVVKRCAFEGCNIA